MAKTFSAPPLPVISDQSLNSHSQYSVASKLLQVDHCEYIHCKISSIFQELLATPCIEQIATKNRHLLATSVTGLIAYAR